MQHEVAMCRFPRHEVTHISQLVLLMSFFFVSRVIFSFDISNLISKLHTSSITSCYALKVYFSQNRFKATQSRSRYRSLIWSCSMKPGSIVAIVTRCSLLTQLSILQTDPVRVNDSSKCSNPLLSLLDPPTCLLNIMISKLFI